MLNKFNILMLLMIVLKAKINLFLLMLRGSSCMGFLLVLVQLFLGTAEDPGFLISLFTSLFNQTHLASSSSTSLSKHPSKSYPHSQRHPYTNSQRTQNHGHSHSNSEINSQNYGHSIGVVHSRPQNQSITISAFSTE